MPESSAATTAREPDGAATDRRRTALAVASVLVPIGAWTLSLAGSYVLQDFTCTNYASAAAPAPPPALGWVLVVLNVVLLVVTLAAGAAGLWVLRRSADGSRPRLLRFLGLMGAALALVFAYSVVLIGVQPLALGVC